MSTKTFLSEGGAVMTSQIILTLVGYFVFSAAAGAMAEPSEAQKRGWYGWFYRFIQRLAANADRLAESKFGSLAGAPDYTDTVASRSTRTIEQRIDVATSSATK